MHAPASISPAELNALRTRVAAELIDVRSPGEFAAAHVPGAQLMPLGELDIATFLSRRGDSDKPLYIICESGGRAKRAIEKFQQVGFNHCVLVEGGTEAWVAAGLPVNRGARKVLPLMRQVQIVVGLLSATGATLALTVHPWFALIPLVMGCGLLFAGISGFCGLALVLAKMPWNQTTGCATNSCCTQ